MIYNENFSFTSKVFLTIKKRTWLILDGHKISWLHGNIEKSCGRYKNINFIIRTWKVQLLFVSSFKQNFQLQNVWYKKLQKRSLLSFWQYYYYRRMTCRIGVPSETDMPSRRTIGDWHASSETKMSDRRIIGDRHA